MSRKPTSEKLPKLDRFGTLRAFVNERLAEIVKGHSGSMSTAIVWFVLFNLANGRDGTIKNASLHRLARLTGMDRATVRDAMKRLLSENAISVATPGRVPVYRMAHATAGDG